MDPYTLYILGSIGIIAGITFILFFVWALLLHVKKNKWAKRIEKVMDSVVSAFPW